MSQVHEGLMVLAMAERLPEGTAARLCAALDQGEITLARDGLQGHHAARFGVIALDEGIDDEVPPARLLERLAFQIDLQSVAPHDVDERIGVGTQGALPSADPAGAEDIAAARRMLPRVRITDDIVAALGAGAMALGADSMRASLLALRAARAAAALDGREAVESEDAELAARLVLGPRATRLPAAPAPEEDLEATAPDPSSDPPEPPESEPDTDTETDSPESTAAAPEPARADAESASSPTTDELILEAARATIPAGLLAQLASAVSPPSQGGPSGRMGIARAARLRGRPVGTRPGMPRDGARLALIDTLRAAAPWQTIRRAQVRGVSSSHGTRPKVEVRASDFRIARLQDRAETTTIFVVDASGSSALHRLAEAKGAVELLLADCYVRRDRVAVIAFRGRTAEVLLPPTRSLARAKRALAGLPGGGGTPLAAGIDAALTMAEGIARRGGTPVLVLLTDGRANVSRDGSGGRDRAQADASQSAQALRVARHASLLIDTSPQPRAPGLQLAESMGAVYLPLPHADAKAMSRAVQSVSADSSRRN
jgi:magnesium chelatase subunit D